MEMVDIQTRNRNINEVVRIDWVTNWIPVAYFRVHQFIKSHLTKCLNGKNGLTATKKKTNLHVGMTFSEITSVPLWTASLEKYSVCFHVCLNVFHIFPTHFSPLQLFSFLFIFTIYNLWQILIIQSGVICAVVLHFNS